MSPWPTSWPKTRLQAIRAHSTLTRPMATKLFIMTESTFFDRTMPP